MTMTNGSEYECGYGYEVEFDPESYTYHDNIIDLSAIMVKECRTIILAEDLAFHSEEWYGGTGLDSHAYGVALLIPEAKQLVKILTQMIEEMEKE